METGCVGVESQDVKKCQTSVPLHSKVQSENSQQCFQRVNYNNYVNHNWPKKHLKHLEISET